MNIKIRLKEIFEDIFDLEEFDLNEEITADDLEEWDSLTNINLIVAIEKEFKIKLALGELQDMRNIGDIISIINRKLS
tara:strand:+ start:327 stop:560 length:234 start_codon:yes stop_codon:yes gene_type:complete